MKLAFCLYQYFPFGGLQRDFLHIAQACYERGHEIHVWTTNWEGPQPENFHIHLVKERGWSNHAQLRHYAKRILKETQKIGIDKIIGFNKIPGLDIYYAADPCFTARLQERGTWRRCLPRYRVYETFEKNIFTDATCDIIYISPNEKIKYQQFYQTPEKKMHWLSPGLTLDRKYPDNAHIIRQQIRAEFNVADDEKLLLMVGSGYQTKGLDRAIFALSALPLNLQKKTKLFVIGKGDITPYVKLAKSLKINDRVQFLGPRCDVPDFLLAGDLLLQPSRVENTGTAILEAMNAGCPVLATETCGYATFVVQANAGEIIEHPYTQTSMNTKLQNMLNVPTDKHQQWGTQGREFAESFDLFSFPDRAANLIESLVSH